MSKLTTFLKLSKRPRDLVKPMVSNGFLKWIPDEQIVRLIFKSKFDRNLNLDNPLSFNEKLQWLKLFYRKPIFTTMVDKYKVRQYIGEKIGNEYLIPLLGVWDNANEIDFGKLPDKFVLKCNHDQGSVIICKDKSSLDLKNTRNYLNKRLKKNHYWASREWPYKNVPRKIIAEEYMKDEDNDELTDYKFFCFNGEARFLYVSTGLNNHETGRMGFYDLNLNSLDFYRPDYLPLNKTPKKPINLKKMISIANSLSKDIPFLRVDLYEINNRIYFSELTFYPTGGYMPIEPQEWDYKLGELIELPEIKNNNYKKG